MAPRAILLDALGTLVTFDADLVTPLARRHAIHVSREDAQRAMRAEMRHYRDHCIEARDRAALAQLRLDCAALIGRELGVDLPAAELVPTLLESIRFAVFPDAPGALARWRASGARLVVASNWDISLHDVLARTGLDELLDGAVTSAEVGAAKPDPALFEAALAVAGVAAHEALHIGDSLAEDVEGARAAGIDAVWLQRDGGADEVDGVRRAASLDEI